MKGILLYILILLVSLAGTNGYARETKKKESSQILPVTLQLSDQAAFSVMGKRLSLGDAIRIVLEKNQDTLSGAYEVAMSDSLYQKYQTKYSPFLNLEGGRSYQKFPEAMGPLAGIDQTTWDVSASIAKLFSTGTLVSAGLMHERTKIRKDPISLGGGEIPADAFGDNEYHRPIMFVSVQQELLKNFFGYSDRRQQEILKNVGRMKRDMLIYQLSGLVVGTVVDYWTVVIGVSAYNNATLQLRETMRVRNIIAQNVRLGLSERFEVNFYNTLVAGAEATVIHSRQRYRDALKKFLRTLNMDESISVAGAVVLSNKLPVVNEESALKVAYAKRADYRNALLSLKNARAEKEIHENEALPSVTARVNMSAMGQRDGIPDAYGDTTTAKYPAWEARVAVTYPLDNREQKINERNAGYKTEQAKLQLDKCRRLVRDEVVSAVEHISTFYRLYQKSVRARRQAETYYSRLLGSLRRGRFSAAVVKNGLDAMVAGRQRELEALVQYNIVLLKFEIAKNELFDIYKIDVNKYIPGTERDK